MSSVSIYTIHDFTKLNMPIIDVRSEGEFEQGHVVGACNIALLNNDERKEVGICYKQKGNYEAVLLGYELAGNKFKGYIQKVLEIAPQKSISVYCFRGGLRSRIMCDLFLTAGFSVARLSGGYKAYRNYVLNTLALPKNINILGGYTGSQKTEKLYELKLNGHQVIDLEKLAKHKGSAYGGIGQEAQPTTEQFENLLAYEWQKIDPIKPLWLEDESSKIGKISIPKSIYIQMRESRLVKVMVEIEKRIDFILNTYGKMPTEELYNATQKLQRRLGNEQCTIALNHLQNGELREWLSIILMYYDKTYNHGNSLRDPNKVETIAEADFYKKYLA
ncbi:MAG: tRNA 2-selenouridine(34) synthase MnmH [Bacteroidota bacterium]|nr:tRNA 2-selenouridine(34) synthase MnmH [Bacteroidota bacterium]